MRSGHHHVFHRQAGGFIHHLLSFIEDATPDHTTICDDKHELPFAIIEREAAGVEFIMNDGGCAILEATIDGAAKLRRDVAGGGTSAEFSGTEGCGKNKTEEDEQAHDLHTRLLASLLHTRLEGA